MKTKMIKIKCAKCGDIIFSHYYGHYASCSCGAIAIDQTEFYVRVNGNPDDVISVNEWSYSFKPDKIERTINGNTEDITNIEEEHDEE